MGHAWCDRLGVIIAGLVAFALWSPLVVFKANRIVPGQALGWVDALPAPLGFVAMGVFGSVGALALLRFDPRWRLVLALASLIGLAVALGFAADMATTEGDKISRTAPAGGLWIAALAFGLLATDSVVKLRLGPMARVALVVLMAGLAGAALWFGLWENVSVLREYANQAEVFWRELGTHIILALGSLAAAVVVGIPLGIVLHKAKPIRAGVVGVLSAIQTVPSIALFGLLIAPLAWVSANIPGAANLGIAGIGPAPAMVALFLYSLMPVVANTLSGLAAVPAAANEAAKGMGMTTWQRMMHIQLPLSFPSLLTAIRVVLVQNIGLATIASLIGGGGLGVFVFQGVGQTAMDLVLLGAVPTVALAFASAVVLDALVEGVSTKGRT
ncbi:ABC transporter permease [Devosia sp. MC532]|uniref:ABC transporter permease n=1 Tax=Devosia sp. MC532 TaxID=2799788 RepID=UPI0018F756D3|nr:ABC transporter permease [Devosia sp. MC532]MBJ7577932.1 ABC transporter permease [Devosia sp. MC532]